MLACALGAKSGAHNINTKSTTAGASDSWESSSDEDWYSDVLDQGLAAHGEQVEIVRDYTTPVTSNCTTPTGAPEFTPPSKYAATSELVYGLQGGRWTLAPVL
jgi:hypothetical protein